MPAASTYRERFGLRKSLICRGPPRSSRNADARCPQGSLDTAVGRKHMKELIPPMLTDKYEFQDVEAKWRELWQGVRTLSWDPDETRQRSYIIDTPPLTVSGYLHIGHIYSYTQTDVIARY